MLKVYSLEQLTFPKNTLGMQLSKAFYTELGGKKHLKENGKSSMMLIIKKKQGNYIKEM
jgi:hypothetical protein